MQMSQILENFHPESLSQKNILNQSENWKRSPTNQVTLPLNTVGNWAVGQGLCVSVPSEGARPEHISA